ncbi:MAG: biotin--[acetyl-CoA-carboxylase] ligase [Chitinophagales bacterium]
MTKTLFTGQEKIWLETVDSTNNFLKEKLKEGRLSEGTVVIAREQQSGRGQEGNQWLSESGQNVTASYVFYPRMVSPDRQFCLSMAVSLALRESCESLTGKEFHIKWPNDIYYGDEKVAGILIENSIQGSRIESCVVGIGLNVNQTFFDISLPNATSLRNIEFGFYPIESVVETISWYLEKYYSQLRQGHWNFLERAYESSMYRYHQTANFQHQRKRFRGQIVGVTKEGKLIIESEGKELKFGLKEVIFIK